MILKALSYLMTIPLAYLMDIFPPLRTAWDVAVMTFLEILKIFYS